MKTPYDINGHGQTKIMEEYVGYINGSSKMVDGTCSQKIKNSKKKVVVVGAGVSGLIAAQLLAKEGLEVVVLEGSNRVGGRAQTYR